MGGNRSKRQHGPAKPALQTAHLRRSSSTDSGVPYFLLSHSSTAAGTCMLLAGSATVTMAYACYSSKGNSQISVTFYFLSGLAFT